MVSLAKWLSVRLRTKWLWVRSVAVIKLRIWRLLRARSSLTFRQSIECVFTLKRVRDMIITCSNFENMFLKIYFQTYYISTELLTVIKPSIIYQ